MGYEEGVVGDVGVGFAGTHGHGDGGGVWDGDEGEEVEVVVLVSVAGGGFEGEVGGFVEVTSYGVDVWLCGLERSEGRSHALDLVMHGVVVVWFAGHMFGEILVERSFGKAERSILLEQRCERL